MRHRAVPRSEGSIQGSVIGWARKQLGLRCDKLSSGSVFQKSGLPDFIVWLPDGRSVKVRAVSPIPQASPLLIEFKKEGEVATAIQLATHKELRAMGYEVEVVDNVEDGKRVILEAIERRKKMR